MDSTLSKVLIFAAGAAVGVAATWKYFEKKYAIIAQAEIDDVKEYYANLHSGETDSESERYVKDVAEPISEGITAGINVAHAPTVDKVAVLASKVEELGYTDYTNKEVTRVREPYVISPSEYGELDDFTMSSLTYYAGDGVLTDEQNEVIVDVDRVVGRGSLNHFGEYEDDSVHVRNERFKTDYEILLDPGKYSDVANSIPHLAEDE